MPKVKHYIDSIYYDVELTAYAMRMLGRQLFENLNLGITIVEHAALDTIFCNAGICQRDLAKLILTDRANTGRILDSLEEKGLITRFVDLKNNRLVKKMGVTEKGHAKLEEVNRSIEKHINTVKRSFTEGDVDQLQKSLRRFREGILKHVEVNI